MFDKNDPSILWVSPAGSHGDGTFDRPFGAIERALEIVKPGTTVVLKRGVYPGDVTFDISGTLHEPIRLVADGGAGVEALGACWFFYDVSDIIVSGITFKEAPFGAISVIGRCRRNRFDNLRFVKCGTSGKTSCTLFFGGSGSNCTMVENCRFEHAPQRKGAAPDPSAMAIGLMVGDGDAAAGEPCTDHVFRKNIFVNYDYGILVGAGEAPAGHYGHIVEYNAVEACGVEGIMVKCSDTLVRGNRVERCPGTGIAVGAGKGSMVDSNRIVDCGHGIMVNGVGHTVTGNCIVHCRSEAIGICGATTLPERGAAQNILVENNTSVDCAAGIRVSAGTTSIVSRNLFSGVGKPVLAADMPIQANGKETLLIMENIAANGCETMAGVSARDVAFANKAADDFTNDSGHGASGWVLKPETFDPNIDAVDAEEDYRCEHGELDEEEPEGTEADPAKADEANAEDFEGFMERFYSDKLETNEN